MPPRLTSSVAAAGLVGAIAVLSGTATAAHTPVSVFPAAGVPVASAKTQITFRGVSPGDLSGVKVRGSSTGTHGGKLRAHSDGQGASFVPAHRFRAGETVTVRANVPLVGAKSGVVSFTIARPPGPYTLGSPGDPAGSPPTRQRFKSRKDLQPPSIAIDKRESSSAGQGYLFVAAKAGPGQDGPMISDDRGQLIWFKRIAGGESVFDFRAQRYLGHQVLTWWQGRVKSGESLGANHIVDSAYRAIATVRAGNGYKADLHEFEISRRNTALVLVYQPVTYGGRTAMDTIVQEVDIPTGLVLYEWHALGQIGFNESYVGYPMTKPFDVAHLNSIQMLPNGDFLVSARNTSAIYKLGHVTGRVKWRLGGKRSDFKMGGSSRPIGQHHARLQPDGSITLFDNGSPPRSGKASRALWLNVDDRHRTVSVRAAYRYPRTISSPSQGSMQVLPSGDVFVGWGGGSPRFTQFDKAGHVTFDGHFDPGDDTYRAYRFPWDGLPERPPDVAASRAAGGKTEVDASWNGATRVARWQVLAGATPAALVPAATVSNAGFETVAIVDGSPAYVAVRALGSSDQVLGTSRTVQPSG